MKILAIDTSTKTLAAGLSDGKREYEYNVDYGVKLSRCLSPALGRILESAGISVSGLDCFACGLGPGSFTGIRIGMATVKGLAWGTGKPVIGVPSLDTIAMNAAKEDAVVVSVVDARRGFVYAGIYSMKQGRAKKIAPYFLGTPERLFAELGRRSGAKRRETVFCGDGIPVIKGYEGIPHSGVRFLDGDYWKPRGRWLMALAEERAEKKDFTDAVSLKPVYLYPKDCQIRVNSAQRGKPA